MGKSIIKHNIKKLSFVERKWFSTNPCLEVVLPQSQETVRMTVNMDFASLYGGEIRGYNVGELGLIMSPRGYGRSSWQDYLENYNYSREHMLYDDSQSDDLLW